MATNVSFDPLSFAGGLVDTVGGIFTAAANRRFQQRIWEDQKQYNTSERIAAQEYNTSERIAAQEYNNPKNQMSRLIAAGINPNSAAGILDGTDTSPQSVSGASASPSFTDQLNPIDFGSLSQIASSVRLTNAQAEAQERQNKYIDEKELLSIGQQKRAIKLAESTAAYQDAQKEWTDQQKLQSAQLFPILASKSVHERDKLKQEVSQAIEQVNLIKEQINNAKKQGRNIDANTALSEANRSVALQQSENLEKQGQILDYDIEQSKFEQTFRDAGIDPHGELGQSLLKMLISDPKKAGSVIISTIDALNDGYNALRGNNPVTPEVERDMNQRQFDMMNEYFLKNGMNPLPPSLRP